MLPKGNGMKGLHLFAVISITVSKWENPKSGPMIRPVLAGGRQVIRQAILRK